MLEVMSREAARAAGFKRYYTGLPCSNGHDSDIYVSVNRCVECTRKHSKVRYERNADLIKSEIIERYNENRKSILERRATYRQENRLILNEKQRQYARENKDARDNYYRLNKEKFIRSRRLREAENPEMFASHRAKRRANKRGAIMTDRVKEDLTRERAILEDASRLTKMTGVKHHVDHVIALLGVMEDGTRIFGPHVWWNLRPLKAEHNLSKHNKVTEDDIQYALRALQNTGASVEYVNSVEKSIRSGTRPCEWVLPDKK